MGQAALKARRREERVAQARERDATAAAGPEAGELPPVADLRPEQIEYWQAQLAAANQRLAELMARGSPDIQVRVKVVGPDAVAVVTQSGSVTAQALVTPDGARRIAAMIIEGADQAEAGAQAAPGLDAPPPGLWTPGSGVSG